MQLPQPPLLHPASSAMATDAMIRRAWKNRRVLRMSVVLPTLELHAEAEVRTIMRLTDRCVPFRSVAIAAYAAVEIQR